MEQRQRLAVYGWIRENYNGVFLDDIGDIIFDFYHCTLYSNILDKTEKAEFINLLFDELKRQNDNQYMTSMGFDLLFRASEHGYDRNKFHKYCNDKGATVTIIHNDSDHVFGGYVNKSWSQFNRTQINDPNAFLFMIRPKMKIVSFHADAAKTGRNAISINPYTGPVFGQGDIVVADKCNVDLCTSYPTTFEFDREEMVGKVALYKVDEYEVFKLEIK